MYQFKFYHTDGTISQTYLKCSKPEELYFDFDGLMDWDEYYSLYNKKLSVHEVLEYAFKVYKGFVKDYYKIEIINDETNEIIDYIEESEVK